MLRKVDFVHIAIVLRHPAQVVDVAVRIEAVGQTGLD